MTSAPRARKQVTFCELVGGGLDIKWASPRRAQTWGPKWRKPQPHTDLICRGRTPSTVTAMARDPREEGAGCVQERSGLTAGGRDTTAEGGTGQAAEASGCVRLSSNMVVEGMTCCVFGKDAWVGSSEDGKRVHVWGCAGAETETAPLTGGDRGGGEVFGVQQARFAETHCGR